MNMSAPVRKLILHSLELFHHLLERTTSVTLEADICMFGINSTVKIRYGMEQAVVVPAPAVSSTILHGFVSSCHNQPCTEDIELRLCANSRPLLIDHNEDTAVEQVELYVQ